MVSLKLAIGLFLLALCWSNVETETKVAEETSVVVFKQTVFFYSRKPNNQFDLKIKGNPAAAAKFLSSLNNILSCCLIGGRSPHLKELVAIILELLKDNRILDNFIVASIAKTFEMKVPRHLDHPKSIRITNDTAGDLIIGGCDFARNKFLTLLGKALNPAANLKGGALMGQLTKIIVEFTVENDIFDFPGAQRMVAKFGYSGGRLPADDYTAENVANVLGLVINGRRTTITKFLRDLYKLFDGRPPTVDSLTSQHDRFLIIYMELLVSNKIISSETASQLAATFGVSLCPSQKPVAFTAETVQNITVQSNREKATATFIQSITILLENMFDDAPHDKLPIFLDILIDFSVDSGFMESPGAVRLEVVLGIVNVPTPSRDDDTENVLGLKLKGCQKSIKIFIHALFKLFNGKKPKDGCLADEQIQFINIVLQFFVNSKLMTEQAATRLTATFGIARPGQKLDPQLALTELTVRTLDVHGEPELLDKFCTLLEVLVANKTDSPKEEIATFTKLLTTFMVHNHIADPEDAAKLDAVLGVTSISLPIPGEANYLHLKFNAQPETIKNFLKEFNVLLNGTRPETDSLKAELQGFFRILTRLLVETDIFDLHSAYKISTTLGVPRPGDELNPAHALTIKTLRSANVQGKAEPRERFFIVLSILLHKNQPNVVDPKHLPVYVKVLLRLVVENGILCEESYEKLITVLGIKDVVIPTPKIPKNVCTLKISGKPEPAIQFLVSFDVFFDGKEPTEGCITSKIADFIKILLDLLVENEIFDKSVRVKLLATFGIEGENEKANILTTTTVRTLKIDGKPEAQEPFLTSLLLIIAKYGPSASPEKKLPVLAKILLDLLVENSLLEAEDLTRLIIVLGIRQVKVPSAGDVESNVLGLNIIAKPDPVIKYLNALFALFDGKAPAPGVLSSQLPAFIRITIEFLVDTGLFSAQAATKITTTFGISTAKFNPEDILTPLTLHLIEISGKKEVRDKFFNVISNIFIDFEVDPNGDASPEHIQSILAKLLVIFMSENGVVCEISGPKLINVLGVDTVEVPCSSKYTSDNIIGIVVKGNPDSVAIFFRQLNALFSGKTPSNNTLATRIPGFIEVILQFLVNNKVLDVPAAAGVASAFGIRYPAYCNRVFETLTKDTIVKEVKVVVSRPDDGQQLLNALQIIISGQPAPEKRPMAAKLLLSFLRITEFLDDDAMIKLIGFTGIVDVHVPNRPEDKDNIMNLKLSGDPEATEIFLRSLLPLFHARPPLPDSLVPDLDDFLPIFLEFLVRNKVMDLKTGVKIATTFGVLYPGQQFDPLDILTKITIKKLTFGGDAAAQKTFMAVFNQIVSGSVGPSRQPVVAKLLLNFALDNKLIDQPSIIKLITVLGLREISIPTPGNKAEENVLNLRLGGNQDAVLSFFIKLNMLLGGRAPSEGLLAVDLPELIRMLLNGFLLKNRIVDARSATQLLATFGVKRRFVGQANPFDPINYLTVRTINIGGNPRARDRFFALLYTLLVPSKSTEVVDLKPIFARVLLNLLVENNIMDAESQSKLISLFNLNNVVVPTPLAPEFDKLNALNIRVNGLEAAGLEFIDDMNSLLNGTRPGRGCISTQISQFIEIVLDLILDNGLFTRETMQQFSATFGIGSNPKDVLTVDNIKNLVINGKVDAREKFLFVLQALLDKSIQLEPAEIKAAFANSLIEFLIDNRILDLGEASKLVIILDLDQAGTKISTFCKTKIPQPTKDQKFSDDQDTNAVFQKLVAELPAESVNIATDLKVQQLFLERIFDLLLLKRILNIWNVANLAATFGMPNRFPENVNVKPQTQFNVAFLFDALGGKEASRKRFVMGLIAVLESKPKSDDPQEDWKVLMRLLVNLLIDNGLLRLEPTVRLVARFDVNLIGDPVPDVIKRGPSFDVATKLTNCDQEAAERFLKAISDLIEHKPHEPLEVIGKMVDFVQHILRLLVDVKVIDIPTAGTLSHVFGVRVPYFWPSDKVIDSITVHQIPELYARLNGDQTGRLNFVSSLTVVLAARTRSDYLEIFTWATNSLMRLLVDNKVLSDTVAAKIVSLFGVNYKDLPLNINFKVIDFDGDLDAAERFIAQLKIVLEIRSANDVDRSNKFVDLIHLLQKLAIDNNIMDVFAAGSIDGTFKIKIPSYYPADAPLVLLKSDTFSKFIAQIKGDPGSRQRFIDGLAVMIRRPIRDLEEVVINLFVRLLAQNRVFKTSVAVNILAKFGISYDEELNVLKPPVDVKVEEFKGNATAAKEFIEKLKILFEEKPDDVTDVRTKLPEFLSYVLKFIIDNKIMDAQIGGSLASVIEIPIPSFLPEDAEVIAISPVSIKMLIDRLGGEVAARKSFVQYLRIVMTNGKVESLDLLSSFTNIILKLLIDNGICNQNVAMKLTAKFGIEFTLRPPKPKVPKPNGDQIAATNCAESIRKLLEGTIGKPQDTASQFRDFFQILIRLLFENKILDELTGHSVAATFGVNITTTFQPDKPASQLTFVDLPELFSKIGGEGPARITVFKTLRSALKKFPTPNGENENQLEVALKVLMTLLAENRVISLEDAVNIMLKFGIAFNVQPVATVAGDTTPCFVHNKIIFIIGGRRKPAEEFINYIRVIFGDRQPVVLKTALPEFNHQLLLLLIRNKILTEKASDRLEVTFTTGVKDENATKPYTLADCYEIYSEIGGSQPAAASFTILLRIIVGKITKDVDQIELQATLSKLLLRLALDNKLFTWRDVQKFIRKFSITDLGQKIVQCSGKVVHDIHIDTVVIKGKPQAADMFRLAIKLLFKERQGDPVTQQMAILNLLLNILVENSLIDVENAVNLLLTFGFKTDDFPQIDSSTGFTSTTIQNLTLKGSPEAREIFIKSLVELVTSYKSTDSSTVILSLAQALLKFMVDNSLLDVWGMVTLSAKFGELFLVEERPHVSTGIDVTMILVRGNPTTRRQFILDIMAIDDDDSGETEEHQHVDKLITAILRLILGNNLVDQPTAERLIVTFGGYFEGKEAPAKLDSADSFKSLVIKGNPTAAKTFLHSIVTLFGLMQDAKPTDQPLFVAEFVKVILRFVVENKIMDPVSAAKLAAKFGISTVGYQIDFNREKDLALANILASAIEALRIYPFDVVFNVETKFALAKLLLEDLTGRGLVDIRCMNTGRQG